LHVSENREILLHCDKETNLVAHRKMNNDGASQFLSDAIECDLLVVGAGINGAGIARDAAGRGLSVVLCDKDDIAAHTSSASTKLVHGGLRYLEQYEFSLVRKALIERETLLRCAPHIIWPLRFIMPHVAGQRPPWLIRAGLFLYDRLAHRVLLPASRGINLHSHYAGLPLQNRFRRGFTYSDCWVDDARLVVLNVMDAAEKGAAVFPRTLCESLQSDANGWRAVLRGKDGVAVSVKARCVVNATGPWASLFQQQSTVQTHKKILRLVKGSHIVVKKLFDHADAYIFQHADHRIVFAIPYERDFSLIGTTDIEYTGEPDHVTADPEEINYLCDLANQYFRQRISPVDVVWSYSGVRPLLQDASTNASAVTRDYTLAFDDTDPPMLSVFGGKITTFRKLAEEAVDLIVGRLGQSARTPGHSETSGWTAEACLPGGDLFGAKPDNRSVLEFNQFLIDLQGQYAFLPPDLVMRYARAYGKRTQVMLAHCHVMADMGLELAPALYAVEVLYLMRYEWARSAEDILWRRSKLGLHVPRTTQALLDKWMSLVDRQSWQAPNTM